LNINITFVIQLFKIIQYDIKSSFKGNVRPEIKTRTAFEAIKCFEAAINAMVKWRNKAKRNQPIENNECFRIGNNQKVLIIKIIKLMKNILFYITMAILLVALTFTILIDAYFSSTPQKEKTINLTIEQTNELFENAYLAGYRKGRHYANLKKLTPFEIDIEEDSALVIGKYWLNDSTPR
jgi:hypothetical protein